MTQDKAGDEMSRKDKRRVAEEEAPETAELGEKPETQPDETEAAENGDNRETEKNEALQEAQAKAEEYLNLAQRVQADFDNFRKRHVSVRAESYEEGARDMIKLILPVVDNLERALEAAGEEDKLREGVAMTYRQMMDILSKRGVEVIDRKGEKFDPRYENAVMRADASQGEPGTVCQVFQKGYRMGETVLRHAMVQVVGE